MDIWMHSEKPFNLDEDNKSETASRLIIKTGVSGAEAGKT